jgi:glycerol-3-phosphate dehydrogenase
VKKYIARVQGKLEDDGFEAYDAWYLVTNYGKQTELILENFRKLTDTDPHWRMIKAELLFALEHEMIHNPMDFLIRRTGRLYFDIESVREHLGQVAEVCALELKADPSTRKGWVSEMEEILRQHSSFTL